MRQIAACCVTALVLSGCTSTPSQHPSVPALPFNVGNGVGSEFGNYEMRAAGETRDAAGNRCTIFNWDRPLNRDYAIRYTSESCESREHPGWMNATTYTRTIVPIGHSNLAAEDHASDAPKNSDAPP
ncbi:MAG TPA: hypothetical protein VMF58_16660 [Rhizomicrobium sp.]|nr:hypothetical protein [Rhizomicrobium sp.]